MRRRDFLYAIGASILTGCRGGGREPALGEGFVAASRLELYQDLGVGQPVVAVAHHGERLEILGRRRKFVRVRTASGLTGWTDGDLLFSKQQMEELRAFGRWATKLPSQGHATVYERLNVHTSPSRSAPNIQQIQEGQAVSVVGHKLISENGRLEDWSLVVLPEEVAGWVLTRRLFMSLPDEVAQYAEGRRIMAYFPLGEVEDRGEVKKNWLWAAIAKGGQPFEFDSLRLFVWSRRRRRYETVFQKRNLRGYYPVEVAADPAGGYRFTLVAQEKDEPLARYVYLFRGEQVRLLNRTPAASPPRLEPPSPAPAEGNRPPRSIMTRWKDALASWFRRNPAR